jgi:hypothetical protein
LGALEVLWEDTDVVGGLGMDDSGRQVLCQTLDAGLDKSGDIRVHCGGFHYDILVISMKTNAPIVFGRIQPDQVKQQMTRPYTEFLQGYQGIILRGDKQNDTLQKPTTIAEVEARLKVLGAKTIGDFYAACGFDRLLVRDEAEKVNYLDLTFSGKRNRGNPASVH